MKEVTPEELIRMVTNCAKAQPAKPHQSSTKIRKNKAEIKKDSKTTFKRGTPKKSQHSGLAHENDDDAENNKNGQAEFDILKNMAAACNEMPSNAGDDQRQKNIVPPFKNLTSSIDKIQDITMPQLPESERNNQLKVQLSEKKNLQRQQSAKKGEEEEEDSIGSLNQGIDKLSDYGGGTLGKKADENEKNINDLIQDDAQDSINAKNANNNDSSKQKKANNKKNQKDYNEDNDLNLSDLDEDQRKELVELEMQIEQANLTRGERRRLQNKRNVLKAKIKKELETEGHKHTISKLQKRVIHLKKMVEQGMHYKEQRDALREENKILKKRLKEVTDKIRHAKEQRRVYQTQIL